jgi:UDPglucose--hexose-1-phosphate uridylyltransferase
MPELRKDPIVGRWVIIATERRARPNDFKMQASPPRGGVCPFCPGNEHLTPPEIMAYRDNGSDKNGKGWSLRVVPNKFPALRIEGDLDKAGNGIYDVMNGVGAHEVIVESPNHNDNLSTISLSAFRNVLWAYRERLADLKKDKRFRYALIFKNHGEQAGASLEHPHSQIIALPIIPQSVAIELQGCQTFFQYRDRCIFCDILRQEEDEARRLILASEHFIVLAPFASRFPFETWIVPRRHSPTFEAATVEDMEDLARIFSDTLKRLNKIISNPPYNFILHTAPIDGRFPTTHEYYHWHFEIMPTLTRVAGFEWGTGFFINPVPPEEAARFLREANQSSLSLTV